MRDPGISTEEAQRTYYRMAMGANDFDVQVSYFFLDFLIKGRGKRWPAPRHAEREKVDAFTIEGLLPDMSPYTSENAADFEKPGFGKRVLAQLRPGVMDWSYYFAHTAARLERLPDSDETPRGFKRFLDPKTIDPEHRKDLNINKIGEVFLSSDKPGPGLVQIACDFVGGAPSPGCHVVTEYRGEYELGYSFSRDYLRSWPEVDRAVKAAFDGFIERASKNK